MATVRPQAGEHVLPSCVVYNEAALSKQLASKAMLSNCPCHELHRVLMKCFYSSKLASLLETPHGPAHPNLLVFHAETTNQTMRMFGTFGADYHHAQRQGMPTFLAEGPHDR